MATQTPRIDLRLSQQSIADIKRFREEMEATQRRTAELKQDLKQMTDLLKAQRVREALIGRGGVGAYVEGSRFRQEQQVRQLQQIGTQIGQNAARMEEYARSARRGLNFVERERMIREALSENLLKQFRGMSKITDASEAQRRIDILRLRLGEAFERQNLQEVRRAERMIRLLERRIELIRQETRERRQQERLAGRMTDAQIAERGRNLSLQRVFGDGGAGLFAIQAGILSNYAIMGGALGGMSAAGGFTADLDLAMRNLQAITVTTDGNMRDLEATLVSISEQTKFTAVDVANAAVTLGQAGLSTREIEDAAEAVSLLATATGTDLPRAVDIATSVLGVFNMESGQVASIADVMTEAVNSSKLNLEKLTLGLQYSGNIAAQLGVRFDELTAALGAMANAGIRSGSTLGTGMRQILISLMDPSNEFQERLARLGLTVADVDVRTQGLYGALANMRDAGFTAADAVQVFEVRAAAAYNALAGNLDQMIDLEQAFQNTTASVRANETQMEAFRNRMANLGSVAGAFVSTAFQPVFQGFSNLVVQVTELIQWMSQFEGTIQFVATALVTLGASFAVLKIAALTRGIYALVAATRAGALATTAWGAALNATTARVATFTASSTAATAAVRGLTVAARLFMGPIGLIATVLGVSAMAVSGFNTQTARLADRLDQARSEFDDFVGDVENVGTQIGAVDDKIEELLNRYDRLQTDSRLLQSEIESVKSQFWEMGLRVEETGDTVDDLIDQLRRLRAELGEEYVARIQLAIDGGEAAVAALRLNQGDQFETIMGRLDTSRGISRFLAPNADLQTQQLNNLRRSIQHVVSPLENRDVSTDDARQVVTQLTTMMNGLREELAGLGEPTNGREATRQASLERRITLLADTINDVRTMMQTIGDREDLEREIARREEEQVVAEERINNPTISGLFDSATELQIGTRPRLQSIMREAPDNDAQTAYEMMQAEAASIQAEHDRIRAEIEALQEAGEITQANYLEISTLLNMAMGTVEDQLSTLAEAAGEVYQRNAEFARSQQQDTINRAIQAISQASETGVREQRSAAERLVEEFARAERERIQAQDIDVADIERELIELDEEVARMQAEIAEAAATRIADLATETERLNDRELAAQIEIATAAYEQAVALAEAALTLDARNEALEEALEAARRVAALTLQQINNDSGATETETEAGIIGLQTDFRDRLAELDDVRSNWRPGGSRRSGGGGGGGGGRQESEMERWARAATTRIEGLTALLETTGSETAFNGIQSTLTDARERLEQLNGQIAAFESRMAAGNLTTQEQERLNSLVADQQRMQQLILQTEQQMIPLLYERGMVMQGLTLQVRQFAMENLDLGNTMMQGVSGALSTMTNALSEFFVTWTSGTKSGGEAFKDLARSVLQSIQQIMARMLAVYMLQRVMGFLFPGAGIPQQSFGQILGGMGFMKEGGEVGFRRAANGERVRGNVNRDAQPYLLMDGEYVLRRSAAQAIGYDQLDQLNAMGNRTVATAGHHGAASQTRSVSGETNIYLIDERSQAGSLGPNDVIAVISDDIARGGTTKKLIKSVQTGAV